MRADHHPAAERRAGRRHRDDLPGEHVRLPHCGAPACEASEPDKYYPSGSRNYVRVVANDAYQGAADAEFAQSQGIKNIYILNDKEAYGLGVATNFRDAAESLGIKVAGFEAWDPKASSYEALMNKIKGTGADAVFLGGLIDENGAQVIKDKVAVLGPNDGAVKLLAPDGFTTQATIDEAGGAAAGMFMSVAGVPIDQFAPPAQEFVDQLLAGPLSGKSIDPYAIYGAQSGQVMLDAIAASDGTRADVIAKLFATNVQDGLLGTFTFSEDGDPVAAEARRSRSWSTRLRTSWRPRRPSLRSRRRSTRRSESRPVRPARTRREGIALPPLTV